VTEPSEQPQPDASATEATPPKKRKPTGRFECRIGLLLGLGGLIGSRLGQLWIAFDVFSQFTLHFAIVTVAFLIGMLMPRAKLLAAFLVIVAGVVAIGIWPHLMSREQGATVGAAPAGQKALRVASFNTLYRNDDAAAVAAEVRRLNADVVALIEMGPSKRKVVEGLRDLYPYKADCFRVDYCNLAILSKYPVAGSEARVQWEGPPYLAATLGPEAGNLTVMAVHTIRFPHSRAQYRQVVALGAFIETMPGLKLVMGDFNATPFSRIIDAVQARSGLRRLSILPTWPTHVGLPQIAIDHIFVSPSITQLSPEAIGEPAGSDHFPVIIDIGVPLKP
jgi:endonuclease/exonuclease/phosphatase (EEP) superfamily protein YafD